MNMVPQLIDAVERWPLPDAVTRAGIGAPGRGARGAS